jgi:hypothetical protein
MSCKNKSSTETEKKAEKVEEAEYKLVEAEAALDTARMDSAAEFSEFKKETERILAANEASINVLKTKIVDQKNELRATLNSDLEALEVENKKLKDKLQLFTLGTNETWESFKASVNREKDKLNNSILEIAEKSKKENTKQ